MKRIKGLLAQILFAGILILPTALVGETVDAVVVSVSGTAESAPPQSISYSPLKTGQRLPIGTTVRTGGDGQVVLQATPGSAVDLGSNSTLRINELAFHKNGRTVTERKARLELSSGVVSALVDPSTKDVTDFQVQTPEGAAASRGTFYTVVVKDGKTYTQVGEGKVAAIAGASKGSL